MAPPDATTDRNRRCARCGAAVSRQFIRVFGTNNTVHGCLECLTRNELALGRAAKQHVEGAGTNWRFGESN